MDANDVGIVLAAPTDVQFSRFDIVEPDVVVVLYENGQIVQEKRIVGAPDLLIEIISPSSAVRDRKRKAALYALNGVQEYWIVDPKAQTVVVQVLQDGEFVRTEQAEGTARSTVLNGFEVSLSRLFRGAQRAKGRPEPQE